MSDTPRRRVALAEYRQQVLDWRRRLRQRPIRHTVTRPFQRLRDSWWELRHGRRR